tara:strand:+ start:29 stop:976 length:948 start_codon:yes stop_codon:yes gene_type:complete
MVTELKSFYKKQYPKIGNVDKLLPKYKLLELYEQLESNGQLESYHAFNSINETGIKINKQKVLAYFRPEVEQQITNDNKIYTNYSIFTKTGRPSNTTGMINFGALDNRQRRIVIPEFDVLVEFDYDAFHLRLIGELINYKFPQGSVHQHFAELYGCNYEQSKKITFQQLYGGIDYQIAQSVEFYGKTQRFISDLWKKFNVNNQIETYIYRRKLLKEKLTDITKNKLFNYYIQAVETEVNTKTIMKLQEYLKDKQTNLILYLYDSFLFDVSKKDGGKTVREIQEILEGTRYLSTMKVGFNYNNLKDVTEKFNEKYN